jgi:threonine-phosphate decarboxylase
VYFYDHGGDIYAENRKIIDFSVNVNPLGMPESVKRAAREAVDACAAYPDHDCRALREAISERFGAEPETIICGNGASDLIYRLLAALKPAVTLLAAPTFSEYGKAALSAGGAVRRHALEASASFDLGEDIAGELDGSGGLVFLCNPNNPTGRLIRPAQLEGIAEECRRRGIFLAVDECFLELSEGYADSLIKCVGGNGGLFVLRAFTKDYAMPGLRLGYGFCSDGKLLDKMRSLGQPWGVSLPAQAAGIAACREPGHL